jgi:hypothetical protein
VARPALVSFDERFPGTPGTLFTAQDRGPVHRRLELAEKGEDRLEFFITPIIRRHQSAGLHPGGIIQPSPEPFLWTAQGHLIQRRSNQRSCTTYKVTGTAGACLCERRTTQQQVRVFARI